MVTPTLGSSAVSQPVVSAPGSEEKPVPLADPSTEGQARPDRQRTERA
jgi:hypothetical protein